MGAAYQPAPLLPELGAQFFDIVAPARFPRHLLRYRNQRWAAAVGLVALDDAEWARWSPFTAKLAAIAELRAALGA